jgi:NAD(P)-dependent dehydrogenase (short-subunit alcohol dehydrogenase family)
MEFKGKVAVITGAASGIGQALAQQFANQGAHVVLADIEDAALAHTARLLQDQGVSVLPIRCDVSIASQLDELAAAAYSRFGAVHILCNNAGVGGGAAPLWMQTPDMWQWVFGVNMMSVIHGIRSFVPRMLAGGEPGHIVNTASVAGLVTGPLMSPYYASKHAVVALSEALYFDLQIVQADIAVSVLCPGFVKTRIAQSERNRPQTGDFGPPGSAEMRQKMKALIEQGAPPDDVARQVLEAIGRRQFWILTHPEMDPRISDRTERILARRNPEHPEMAARSIAK